MDTSRKVFILGVLVFLAYKLAFTGIPLQYRDLPVEVDDAMTYIAKSAQFEDCAWQDCPALIDLRPEVSAPSDDPKVLRQRWLERVRLYVQYSPLYNLTVTFVHSLGWDWESAYNTVRLLGACVITAGLAVFFYSLFGPMAAGLALILLAGVVFPGRGLNHVVPFNITLALGFLTWGLALKRQPGQIVWLPLLTLVMLTFHYAGRIWAVIALVVFLFRQEKWPPDRKDIIALSMSVLLIFLVVIGPKLMGSGVFSMPEMDLVMKPLAPVNVVQYVKENLKESQIIVARWGIMSGGVGLGLILVIIALIQLPKEQRRSFIALLIILGGLFVVMQFLIGPRVPKNMVRRFWSPLGVALTGAICFAFCQIAPLLLRKGLAAWREKGELTDSSTLLSRRGGAILGLAICVLIAGGMGLSVAIETAATVSGIQYTILRHDYTINKDQPGLLFENKTCETVIYETELVFHPYLLRGGHQCGAIFLPVIINSPEEKIIEERRNKISHAVFQNPVMFHKGLIPLFKGKDIRLSFDPEKAKNKLYLLIKGGEKNSILHVSQEKELLSEISVKANSRKWTEVLDLSEEKRLNISIRQIEPVNKTYIAGVRIASDNANIRKNVRWPWNQGVTIAYRATIERHTPVDVDARFNLYEKIPLKGVNYEVLDDHGFTVLARIRK